MAEWKIDITRAVKDIAERALDDFEYKGLTIRQWADKITSGEYQLVKHGNNCDIPRYIDAEALKKDLTRFYDNETAARELIDEQPTADVQPVKHGRFKAYSEKEQCEVFKKLHINFDGCCSECNGNMFDSDKFCAECGAIMEGVSK